MKTKILLFLIIVIGVSLVTYSASGTTKPRGYGSIVKVFGVKVGTPKQAGEIILKIKINPPVKPGETKPGPPVTIEKKITILKGDTPEDKARKIAAAANEAIEGLKAEGTSLSGKNGEVTLELPTGLAPEVELRSKETGEKDKAMSSSALDDFYAELPETTPPDDPPEEEGDSVSRPYEVIGDSTTTNTYLNSIILYGIPSGTWQGAPAGGVVNVTVGVDAYSLPTQGLQLQDIAAMIFNHYNGLGYEVTLTGDPAAGFEISTGYFCTSVEALDDTLEIGLGMKIDAIDGPQD